MSTNSRDPQVDSKTIQKGPVLDDIPGVVSWGKRWLKVLINQEGIEQAWIAEVDEDRSIHWISNKSVEPLPKQFSVDALQNVIHHGKVFIISDHVEVSSGGLFPLVHDGQVIGIVGLLGYQTDYFKPETISWVRTLTKIISDSLFQEKNGERAQEVEQAIARILQGSLEVHEALPVILESVASVLEAEVVTVLRYNPASQRFEILDTWGFEPAIIAKLNLYFETGMAGKSIFKDNQPIWIEDLQDYPSGSQLLNRLDEEGFRGYGALPLMAHNELVGALEIAWRKPQYSKAIHADFLTRIAQQVAFALERTYIVKDLRQRNMELATRYNAMVEGLSRALELRDLETEGHTRRVSTLTMHLVKHMQIPPEQWDAIRVGALLHDIGKIGIPDAILLKPGSLTEQEKKIMQQHVLYGYKILASIINARPALDITLYHHERWDGKGYPYGLNGEQIPLVARLFAIVDVYDALISDRPYRPAWSRSKVLDYIKAEAGGQFDPKLVKMFMDITDENK